MTFFMLDYGDMNIYLYEVQAVDTLEDIAMHMMMPIFCLLCIRIELFFNG